MFAWKAFLSFLERLNYNHEYQLVSLIQKYFQWYVP
ncbi:hypothetical protein FOVG_19969 [Fusarium oxysporum f. sp. pisi HDV247]|uniref:Uncharacterized protein n=1 Tax=Fusarium oxysporum f. sp. pisi HDV247 TaxID=1080344 RepID=W9NKM7_FUSOX|nr:hypothetical protein FOVG_19969 [Fusarium oxysporum f. sp. pisi HDV247]